MRLLIKFPTRSRPAQFLRVFEVYRNLLSGEHDVQFLVTCDDNDPSMWNADMRARLDVLPNVTFMAYPTRTKVQAINRGLTCDSVFDVLLVASDDMYPQETGYDAVVATAMRQYFPDLDGVLWFHDGYAGRRLNTIPCMGRPYFLRFGYVYHPDYLSLFCDDEFTCVAERLGKQVFIDRVIIRHEHFVNNAAVPRDALYDRNERTWDTDRALYELRAARGFWLGDRWGNEPCS